MILVALFYEESHNVLESIKKTTSLLKGTWGISLLCIDQPNTLYCTRHGSPLLVGIENDLAIVTSEHSGFCNLLSKYIVLNNNDICILNFDGSHVTMKTEESYIQQNICNQNHDLTPGKYSHWTLKEIYEQTDSSLRAMSLGGRLLSSNKVMLGGLESHVDMLMSLNNLILLGCGTSFHAGLLGSHFFKEICNFNVVQVIDDGNMNWLAAQENEAASLSMSANYWKNVCAMDSERWVRNNVTKNIKRYIKTYDIFYSDLNKIESILDVGCSGGISTEYIKRGFPETEKQIKIRLL